MESFSDKLLQELNFARTKPFEYATKLLSLEKYFEGKIFRFPNERPVLTKEGFGSFNEAAHHLAQMAPLQPLVPNKYLTNVAQDALKDIQNVVDTRGVSLLNYDILVRQFGWIVGSFNEAVELGSSNPELIVAHLLSDDGDLDRGNRKHLMNPNYKLLGIATGPHKVFGQANVLTYSSTFFSYDDEQPQVKDSTTKPDDTTKTENQNDQPKSPSQNDRRDISTTPKVTYSCEENSEVITNQGKRVVHSEVEKNEVKGDGYLSYSYFKSTRSNLAKPEELPEDIIKIEKNEKVVVEDGKKVKITTITKYKKDGSISTETSKQDL